jgi:hypothetical protein
MHRVEFAQPDEVARRCGEGEVAGHGLREGPPHVGGQLAAEAEPAQLGVGGQRRRHTPRCKVSVTDASVAECSPATKTSASSVAAERATAPRSLASTWRARGRAVRCESSGAYGAKCNVCADAQPSRFSDVSVEPMGVALLVRTTFLRKRCVAGTGYPQAAPRIGGRSRPTSRRCSRSCWRTRSAGSASGPRAPGSCAGRRRAPSA